jgi:hypothetical protein
VRPGYELWRPNREKPGSITTKFVVVLLLAATAVIAALVTIGGWPLLKGGSGMGIVCAIYAILYAFFAIIVARWNRGVLPVAAALAIIMLIFAAVAGPGWFDRDKSGFTDPNLPSAVLGTLTYIVIPVQALLIIFAMRGFQQAWNVEVERYPDGGSAAAPA